MLKTTGYGQQKIHPISVFQGRSTSGYTLMCSRWIRLCVTTVLQGQQGLPVLPVHSRTGHGHNQDSHPNHHNPGNRHSHRGPNHNHRNYGHSNTQNHGHDHDLGHGHYHTC